MADIRTAKAKGLVRLVWNQDLPIPRAVVDDVIGHNKGVLVQDGERRRRQMAIAADYRLREIADETGIRAESPLEMEFEMAGDGDDEISKLESGFRVQATEAHRGRGRPRK